MIENKVMRRISGSKKEEVNCITNKSKRMRWVGM
jgi:hypothetical protein